MTRKSTLDPDYNGGRRTTAAAALATWYYTCDSWRLLRSKGRRRKGKGTWEPDKHDYGLPVNRFNPQKEVKEKAFLQNDWKLQIDVTFVVKNRLETRVTNR